MSPSSQHIFEFGDFRLDADEKVLWRGTSVADVTPKAVETLLVLVENAGRIVSKEEIFGRVWPNSFVEEANLTHHVFRLRKLLGDTEDHKFIETVPKRGYRFVGEVRERNEPVENKSSAAATLTGNLSPTSFRPGFVPITAITLLGMTVLAFIGWKIYSAQQQKPVLVQSADVPTKPLSINRITNIGKVGGAAISPDGKFVAYMQNHTHGEGTLYVRQVETNTESKLLTPEARFFGSLSFSPDGGAIYYISFDDRDKKGALYRISVLGGQPTRLLEDVGYMFTISPDGQSVAFFRKEPELGKTSLVTAAVDGTTERKLLTRSDTEMNFGVCPAWSPNGDLIAISAVDVSAKTRDDGSVLNLYTVATADSTVKKLSEEGLSDTGKMVWKPDGSAVVLIGDRGRSRGQIYEVSYPDGKLSRITKELSSYGHYGLGMTADGKTLVADVFESTAQLWAIDANGSTKTAEQLTLGVGDGSRGLATLSDGGIVYAARTGDDSDLWIMTERNGKREGRPLTTDGYYEGEICTTPDNNTIVFASDRGGDQHLFRINQDGSGLRQLTFGESFDRAPSCSPDSNSIIYASRRGDTTYLWKISVEGAGPVQISDFEADAPSFSPDGRLVACVIPSDNVINSATISVISADGGPPIKSFPVLPFSWSYRPPHWSAGGDSILFIKTANMVGNLWEQKLSGGEPKQFTDFKSESMFDHALTRDGTKLIISRGKFSGDVVMLKNFL